MRTIKAKAETSKSEKKTIDDVEQSLKALICRLADQERTASVPDHEVAVAVAKLTDSLVGLLVYREPS